jgi:hypothetical protein
MSIRALALALTSLAILDAGAIVSSAAMAAPATMSMDDAINQIEKTAVSTIAGGAAEVCRSAIKTANGQQPQLYKSYADLQAAQAKLAPGQQKLHLASLSLQNTDCASDAKKTDATCQQLNAAYEAARSDVLGLLGPVQAAEAAYLKNQASYGKAVADANTACVIQLSASIPALVGNQWDLLQTLYGGLNGLIGSAEASSVPDLGSILIDLIPRPRIAGGGGSATNWAGNTWTGYRGRSRYDIRLADNALAITWTTDSKPDGEYYDCKLSGPTLEVADCKWKQVGTAGGTVHLAFKKEAAGDRISGKAFDGKDYWDIDIFRDR